MIGIATKRPRGLLLLQDWGLANDKETLEGATGLVADLLTGKVNPDADPTQQRLFSSQRAWGKAIQSQDWWVSNAVWALRTKGKKSGYLCDKIHKAAFPIWLEVVAALAKGKDDFKLVVAGAWARFDDRDEQIADLPTYLREWVSWTYGKRNLGRPDVDELLSVATTCKGKVWYADHPCIWSGRDLQAGPP